MGKNARAETWGIVEWVQSLVMLDERVIDILLCNTELIVSNTVLCTEKFVKKVQLMLTVLITTKRMNA